MTWYEGKTTHSDSTKNALLICYYLLPSQDQLQFQYHHLPTLHHHLLHPPNHQDLPTMKV